MDDTHSSHPATQPGGLAGWAQPMAGAEQKPTKAGRGLCARQRRRHALLFVFAVLIFVGLKNRWRNSLIPSHFAPSPLDICSGQHTLPNTELRAAKVLESLRSISASDCCAACQAATACAGFSFNGDDCNLLSADTDVTPIPRHGSVSFLREPVARYAAIPTGAAPSKKIPQSDAVCKIHSGFDYRGGDLREVYNINRAEGCCEECAKQSNCQLSVFCGQRGLNGHEEMAGTCYLKVAGDSIDSTDFVQQPLCDLVVSSTVNTAYVSSALKQSVQGKQRHVEAPESANRLISSKIESIWSSTTPLEYLVVALSARGNIERRNNIRELWGKEFLSEAMKRDQPSAIYFAVGNNFCAYSFSPGEDICGSDPVRQPTIEDKALWKEQQQYGDIMFVDIEDSYQNSAAKMLRLYEQIYKSKRAHVFCCSSLPALLL